MIADGSRTIPTQSMRRLGNKPVEERAVVEDTKAATGRARRLLARSRLPTFRGYAHSAPRYGLRGVGCLKQMPNTVFQQFDSPLQSAELFNPHYCDGHVQIK